MFWGGDRKVSEGRWYPGLLTWMSEVAREGTLDSCSRGLSRLRVTLSRKSQEVASLVLWGRIRRSRIAPRANEAISQFCMSDGRRSLRTCARISASIRL